LNEAIQEESIVMLWFGNFETICVFIYILKLYILLQPRLN
jgi:hypothetical protein